MATENHPNPSSGASSPKRESEVPTRPSVVHPAETEKSGGDKANKVANRLAHKANKTEQAFEDDNSKLFSK
jgi:hypothetical protein